MKVSLLLADFAQVSEGKLSVLGAGWTAIGPDVGPSAVAMLIDVPWDQTIFLTVGHSSWWIATAKRS